MQSTGVGWEVDERAGRSGYKEEKASLKCTPGEFATRRSVFHDVQHTSRGKTMGTHTTELVTSRSTGQPVQQRVLALACTLKAARDETRYSNKRPRTRLLQQQQLHI